MRDVYVVGVSTLKFGKYGDRSVKDLAAEAVRGALADAGVTLDELEAAWFANSAWGLHGFQHCVRGQVALRGAGVEGIPITNVENACAGGSTALHEAWSAVAGGHHDVALAIGAEKIWNPNKYSVFASFLGGTDVERIVDEAARVRDRAPTQEAVTRAPRQRSNARPLRARLGDLRDQAVVAVQLGEAIGWGTLRRLIEISGRGGRDHSPFMDIYAYAAREHMARHGTTARQLAAIASKNHWHSSLNPNAQYTFEVSIDRVLADRIVAPPLTRAMCAPIGDGAAAAIVMSAAAVRRRGLGGRAVRVRASVLGSGRQLGPGVPGISERLAAQAYERARVGPDDIDCAEVHDATAFGELHQSEALGFFPLGEGGRAAERGDTRIGGAKPINTSGGLLSRGHPVGASGLAQIHELVTQLRREAGARQVANARIALAENGGGALEGEEAAMCLHVLEGPERRAK